MAEQLDLDTLRKAVAGTAAAFRSRTTLQPAGGEGDKVFPPTYAGAVYAEEQRRLPGREEPVTCVLLDSVQSQANRMEEALQEAVDRRRITLPVIEVDFSEANENLIKPIDGRITSLTVPHRLADAILRDSVITQDGEDKDKLFRDSSYAEHWRRSSAANATAIYELCPTALVFGVWGAPEKPGGLGAKFQRCVTSEIVGIDAVIPDDQQRRRGIRRGPLGVVKDARVLVDDNDRWTVDESGSKKSKRPSEINHGPIPFDGNNAGITCRKAQQTVVLTLAGLRRLKFPPADEQWKPSEQQRNRDEAGQTVLAALALCAAALAEEAGHDLRSGCLLHSENQMSWELLDRPGKAARDPYFLDAGAAVSLLNDAVEAARQTGLEWHHSPIILKPSEELGKLVHKSQQLAKESEEAEN